MCEHGENCITCHFREFVCELVGCGLRLRALFELRVPERPKQLPLDVSAQVIADPLPGEQDQLALQINADLTLDLYTLAGELDFYIEAFWTHVATFKIVGWEGLHHKIPIFRTPTVQLGLGFLGVDSIRPPADNPNPSSTN